MISNELKKCEGHPEVSSQPNGSERNFLASNNAFLFRNPLCYKKLSFIETQTAIWYERIKRFGILLGKTLCLFSKTKSRSMLCSSGSWLALRQRHGIRCWGQRYELCDGRSDFLLQCLWKSVAHLSTVKFLPWSRRESVCSQYRCADT